MSSIYFWAVGSKWTGMKPRPVLDKKEPRQLNAVDLSATHGALVAHMCPRAQNSLLNSVQETWKTMKKQLIRFMYFTKAQTHELTTRCRGRVSTSRSSHVNVSNSTWLFRARNDEEGQKEHFLQDFCFFATTSGDWYIQKNPGRKNSSRELCCKMRALCRPCTRECAPGSSVL